MAAARNKVVRVENVTPTVHFREGSYATSEDGDYKSDLRPVDISPDFDDYYIEETQDFEENELLGEAADDVPPLPEGWPRIPQLFVRRSWDFSTATSPSVNKVTAHLEMLQNTIEDWFHDRETEIMSRVSMRSATQSRATSVASTRPPTSVIPDQPQDTSTPANKKQLRFLPSSATSVISSHRSAAPSKRSHKSGSHTPQLSVQGIGAIADKDGKSSHTDETGYEIPYLGAEEVIDEVILLLARLENDRCETKGAFKKEEHRLSELEAKIDNLAEQRMAELPQAVQLEHEACAMDINELNWHVSYRSRVETRIKNKVQTAEILNSRLSEDIAFVKKHCPLVGEKLDLESEAMDRIKMAQLDTNDELGVTVERCAKVESKSEEAIQKAAAERAHIRKDLDSVRQDLQTISGELAEAKMTFNTYIHQCNDYRQQLKDNEQELQVLEVRCENAKAAEAMQTVKVRELQQKINEQETERKRFEDIIAQKRYEFDSLCKNNSSMAEQMTQSIQEKEDLLHALTRQNQESDLDIEDHISKINKCDRAKVADEKNLIRMAKEMEKTREQMKAIEDEHAKIQVITSAVRTKLQKEEEKCVREEEQLKATAEALRKQVKEEIHSRTIIQARINSDSSDLNKNQTEIKQKKEKVTKKVSEVDGAVQVLLEKVKKLRAKHADRTKTIEELRSTLEGILNDKKEAEEKSDALKLELRPQLHKLKDDVLTVEKQTDHMDWKSDLMKKNIDDMGASERMMGKSMDKTQVVIDDLQEELDELTIKINSLLHHMDDLKGNLDSVQGRNTDQLSRHRDTMRERKGVLQKHEEDYQETLKSNAVLASKYRQLQNEFVNTKNCLLDKYDRRVKVELAIKDLKQVRCLQKRMHSSLNEYYKYRGQYNQSELARMESECANNAHKVGELQGSMDNALDQISQFLRTQMDGGAAHRIAMEKVLHEESLIASASQNKLKSLTPSTHTRAVPPVK